MTDKFELVVHANFGVSRPIIINFETEEEMVKAYNETALEGNGNVIRVEGRKNGKTVLAKWTETN